MDSQEPASTPPASAAPQQPQIVIQSQPSMFGRFGKLLLFALFAAILIILGLVATYQSYFNPAHGPQEKYHSLARHAVKKIAIIKVEGAILDGDGFIKQQIDRVREDDNVVGVVLRINSPGGTVTASDYIYHHLRELTKERELPLVVSMGSICASGGYYIAMAVGDQPDGIYAERTTWTGSIGVIIPHYDLSELLKSWHIEEDSISSGPLKQMGNPLRPMTEKERQLLQGLVDESFEGFKQVVQHGRRKFQQNPALLKDVTTGQVFTADQALQEGLIDKIGFIEAAIDRVAELAGQDPDALRCVKYEKPQTAVDTLLGVQAAAADRSVFDAATWLNLTAPRAYYLYTWLPPLLTNTRGQ